MQNQGPYKALLKLNVPGLSIASVVERNLPQPLDFVAVFQDYAVQTPSGVRLSTILSSRFEGRDQLGGPILRHFATLSELDTDAVPGPTVQLQDDKFYSKHLSRMLQWPERHLIIAFWGWPDYPIQKDAPVPDKLSLPRLETYDTRTGERLVAFAPTSEHGVLLHDVVLGQKAGLVLGALSSLNPAEGGVAAWDPITGRLLQRLSTGRKPASWLWLSGDETRLVVITVDELQFFKIK